MSSRPHGREAEGDRSFAAIDAPRATILGRGIAPNLAASTLLDLYNDKGVFNNRDDDLAHLSEGLRERFAEVAVAQEGCVAIFRAS